MQSYDIIMLIVVAIATFIGFRKGLAWQIASVAAIVVSYIAAVQFRDVVAAKIDTEPPWNTALAMLILYIGTSFVIWMMFQFVRGIIDRAQLKEFDRQLGAIFGLAKGVLLCVIITLFAVTLLSDDLRRQVIDSRSGLYIARLLDKADSVMPAELQDFLHPYVNRLDEELDGRPESESPEQEDEFDRLEDWLENRQGSSRVGDHDAATDYRASDDARQRRYLGY